MCTVAAAYYTRGWFRAQINIENLTDERYFPGSYNYVFVNVGQPFTVRGANRRDVLNRVFTPGRTR